jgi:hypothetical protein
MNVYSVFRGDDNSALQMVQFDAYSEAIGHMVHEAVTQYFNAEKFLNTKTTLGNKIREEEKESLRRGGTGKFSFDHRTIQNAHDVIAGNYRYLMPYFPLFPDFPDKFDKDDEKWKWLQHLVKEIKVLYECLAFTRCCLIACVYANSDQGMSAEHYMGFYLAHRYRSMYGLALEKEEKNLYLESISKYTNWRNDLLSCVQCAWEGKYSQSGQNNCESIREYFCPSCASTMTVIPLV